DGLRSTTRTDRGAAQGRRRAAFRRPGRGGLRGALRGALPSRSAGRRPEGLTRGDHDLVLTPACNRLKPSAMSETGSSQGAGSGASPVPPADGEAILWTDGAARGNPGPAGCGAILKAADGRVLAAESQYLGHPPHNVAEYKALLLGLRRALEAGVRRIGGRADSELLVRQRKGEYRVKNEGLKPLAA